MTTRLLISLALMIVLSNNAIPAAAENFQIGVIKNDYSFEDLSEVEDEIEIGFTAAFGESGVIIAEIVDILVDSNGKKNIAPLGATPYSVKNYVTLIDNKIPYIAGVEKQKITTSIKFINVSTLTEPILGGVRIYWAQGIDPNTRKPIAGALEVGAVSIFSYTPPGSGKLADFEPFLAIGGPNIFLSKGENFIYRLLPNFKNFLNSNNLAVGFDLTNQGNIFLSTESKMTISRIYLFNPLANNVIFEKTYMQSTLMPTERINELTEIVLTSASSPQKINPISSFGIYRATISSTAKLGRETSITPSASRVFIVAPWKPILLFISLISLLFLSGRRSITQKSQPELFAVDNTLEKILEEIRKEAYSPLNQQATNEKKKPPAAKKRSPVKKKAKARS